MAQPHNTSFRIDFAHTVSLSMCVLVVASWCDACLCCCMRWHVHPMCCWQRSLRTCVVWFLCCFAADGCSCTCHVYCECVLHVCRLPAPTNVCQADAACVLFFERAQAACKLPGNYMLSSQQPLLVVYLCCGPVQVSCKLHSFIMLDDSISGDILNLCSRADAHARIHDVPGSVFIICMHEAFSCLLHACVQAA